MSSTHEPDSTRAGTDETSPVILRITSRHGEIRSIRRQVHSFAQGLGFSDDETAHITLAVDEALVNVIEHGYGGPCDKPIEVELRRIARQGRTGISICIRDQGRQVDPATIQGRNLDEVRPGGLGVHIIHSVMDEVEFQPAGPEGMLLKMTKMRSQ